LHILVYPPLWEIKADLATRYAKIGVVTTAAEIFESLGMFPEAVECYQRASKLSKAEMIIEAALKTSETPRMWLALGDITKDPTCYKKAIDLSNGRFSSAFVALGKHCFENGDLRSAGEYIEKALQIKPLNPGLWFYYGTLNMKLEQWDISLKAFSEVVQQEPEEGEAWANIAAIHMRMLQPDKAYPALAEALKQNRNNWRMWWSKLFVCLDMRKYDEAIQSCNQLLDLRTKMNMEASIPLPEERCIRGLVGGSLKALDEAKASYDAAAVESAIRTIDRLSNLLYRLSSVTSEPWIWHVSAYFNDKLGRAALILNDRLKEYRSLQTSSGWETDAVKLKSIIDVALQINAIYQQEGSKESYARAHLMLNRLIKRIKTHYVDSDTIPEEVALLEAEIKDFSTMDEKNNL
jgi:tetratricopeptide (TPR) repeat protein